LRENGTDTLITGELRQEHFNLAQEEGLNLYLCGHYATERYGVTALAGKMASQFGIPSVFLKTSCPL
jgi:putative NIF3 family GTP cyclohydrolase 1 type 2